MPTGCPTQPGQPPPASELGFFNTLTERVYPTSNPACPRFVLHGRAYARYPCVALNEPVQGFDFILQLTNTGNTAVAFDVGVMDTLPVKGDTGVLLADQPRGTQWTTPPCLLSAPEADPGVFPVKYTSSATVGQSVCFELVGGAGQPAGCAPAGWSADLADRGWNA